MILFKPAVSMGLIAQLCKQQSQRRHDDKFDHDN